MKANLERNGRLFKIAKISNLFSFYLMSAKSMTISMCQAFYSTIINSLINFLQFN